MTKELLADELVTRVMGWKTTPDRFIKSGRNWLPKWRFSPLTCLDDTFQLLNRARSTYAFTKNSLGTVTAQVSVGDRAGSASGRSEAVTISVALARALGIQVDSQEDLR